MLQRIQSIFLFGAFLSCGALLTDPMSLISVSGDQNALQSADQNMLGDGIFHSTDHLLLLIMVALGMIVAIVALFKFKNRKQQATLSRIGIAVSVLYIILGVILFFKDFQLLNAGTMIEVDFGVLAPILNIIFLFLALRYILKDEKLVRSMDRLR